jgi:endonuclease YncB( thermonuclease family)
LLLWIAWCALLAVAAAGQCFSHQIKVERIIDGDTFVAITRLDFDLMATKRIRLARIDAPESGQPGYAEAVNALTNLLRPEQWLQAQVCSRDSFGRWVADITLPDGRNLSDTLLAIGVVKRSP